MNRSLPATVVLILAGLCPFSRAAVEKDQAERTSVPAATGPTVAELQFDFGHVGVDYMVLHDYPFVNRGQEPIRVLSVAANCDCSSASTYDSVIAPGDTGYFRLTYSTRNDFGPMTRTFRVRTDHPQLSEIIYTYRAIVGQWLDAIKPNPAALFFLPGRQTERVSIANISYREISLAVVNQFDTTFDVTLLRETAPKDQALELEITPRSSLARGTYFDNLTLRIEKGPDQKPTILTIPVKIVRY